MKRVSCKLCMVMIIGMLLIPQPVFADTITDALMEQARVEGERINAVQRALWLRWLDRYNQYIADLTSGVASPAAPAWSTSMAAITSYLPTGFPSANYALALSGDEITVTRNGMTPEVAMYVPLYVPLATLPDATTARLLVTRPTTFVGTEVLTKSMVRNSGLPVDPMTSTTFLPGANVTFGSGATMEMQSNGRLEFTDNNGRILGVNELEAARIVPVTAAAGLTIAANSSITGNLSVSGTFNATGAFSGSSANFSGQMSGGSLRLGNGPSYMTVTVSNAGAVTFGGTSFAFSSPISMQGQTLDARYLRTDAASTLNSTVSMGNTSYINGTLGDAKFRNLISSGTLTAQSLTLAGRTGATAATAYNVFVENSNKFDGKTFAQAKSNILADVTTGHSEFKSLTSYQTVGNTTLTLRANTIYKIGLIGGNGWGNHYDAGPGGAGAMMILYIKPKANLTATLYNHPGGRGDKHSGAGGNAAEIRLNGTPYFVAGGGGGGGDWWNRGGNAGIPVINTFGFFNGSDGVVVDNRSPYPGKGSKNGQPGVGGNANSNGGTRNGGTESGGAGYGGGGGSNVSHQLGGHGGGGGGSYIKSLSVVNSAKGIYGDTLIDLIFETTGSANFATFNSIMGTTLSNGTPAPWAAAGSSKSGIAVQILRSVF